MNSACGADGSPLAGYEVSHLPSDDRSPLAGTEVHYLRSEQVGDEFKIFVGHCGGTEGAAPVVLYVSDANGLFASAVDIVRLMQLSAHLPPILVCRHRLPHGRARGHRGGPHP